MLRLGLLRPGRHARLRPRGAAAQEAELPLEPLPVADLGDAELLLQLLVREALEERLAVHPLGQEGLAVLRDAGGLPHSGRGLHGRLS